MPCRIHGYPSDTCNYCTHTLKTQIYQVKHKYTHHRYCNYTLEAQKYLALTCIVGIHKDTHHTYCRHTLQTHRDSVKIQIYPSHRDCSYTLEAQISHMHCRCTQRYPSHRLQTYTANTQRLQTRGVTAQSWSHDGVRRLEGDQPGQRLAVDPWTSTYRGSRHSASLTRSFSTSTQCLF